MTRRGVAQCLELMQALQLIREFGEFVVGKIPAVARAVSGSGHQMGPSTISGGDATTGRVQFTRTAA